MNEQPTEPELTKRLALQVESIWDEQVSSWQSGKITPAETFFERHPELLQHAEFAVDVIFNEYAIIGNSDSPASDSPASDSPTASQQDLVARFPQFKDLLEKQFTVYSAVNGGTLESTASQLSLKTQPVAAGDSSWDILETKAGRFELKREIGRGAMAIVYEAFDHQLQKTVAVKKPLPHVAQSSIGRSRLIREARAVAKLHHPGIVPIREIHQATDGLFLVSPLIQGDDLMKLASAKPIAPPKVVSWGIEIAEAADYAHQNGVVHRDIKPANILIEHDQARLADFGLAADSDNQLSITRSGELLGTPAFMAPEQADNSSDLIDGRTDVYSIGATMYFMLTGQPPFTGSFAQVMHQLLDATPQPLRNFNRLLEPELEIIVGKCLQKSPGDRYASARELADDLRRLQNGEPILAKAIGWLERTVKFARRRPQLTVALGLIIMLIVFATGMILQLANVTQQRNRAQAAEQSNSKLLAASSLDAALLAMQRGRMTQAIAHYETGLTLAKTPQPQAELQLLECYLSVGRLEDATRVLLELESQMNDQPLDSSDVITWQATADYWKQELAALGVSQFDIEADAKFDPANLPAGKRAFLLALQSSSSPEAMEHLRNAVAADPYHYSARRMLLTLALSLAQFEEVLQNAQMAQQLYPEDVDFVLIESLALAAQARLNDAAERIRQTPLTPQQQQNWIDFGQFIKRLCHDVHPRQGIYRTDLSTISKLLAEFELKFQPLVLKRRWRFPPKVAEPFAELPNVLETSNSFPANRALASQLASIHPEGTLLLIAAESSIANKETPEQLETARDFFQQAVDAPSFIQNSEQIAWLGVYTMSMSLSILHKHDVEQNSERYVEACRHLDANKINNAGYLRTISITLGQQNQWDVARPFLDQWISLNPEGSQKFDAYWSKAVALKSAQEWVELLEFCNGLLSQYPELSSRDSSPNGYDWIGLRDFAIGQLKSRIGQSPFQKPPEEQRPPEINLDGGPPASG